MVSPTLRAITLRRTPNRRESRWSGNLLVLISWVIHDGVSVNCPDGTLACRMQVRIPIQATHAAIDVHPADTLLGTTYSQQWNCG